VLQCLSYDAAIVETRVFDLKELDREQTDYIIIGAGSAGSVLARRLSQHHHVTLLEAGPKDHAWDYRLHMPAALSHVLSNDRYNWFYHSEPEPGLNNRRAYCPRGRVLGGSSSINGMIFVRGNRSDFDDWAKAPGMESWGYDQCLPYFKRSEAAQQGDDLYRGRSGPMHISRGKADNPLFEAWLAAGEEVGIAKTSDFNGECQEGVGVYDRTIKAGRRFSAAKGYLAAADSRTSGSLTISSNSLVRRILIKGKKAEGVEYLARGLLGDKPKKLYARQEVILCGGAINSPHLLMLSGIGNASELKDAGVDAVVDLPGVGQNLQDHLEIYVQFACKQPVSIYPSLHWYNQAHIGLQWYLMNTGAGATNHFETGAFLRSSDEVSYPDLQFHFLPVAMNYDGSDRHNGHGFQVHVGPMKPTSRGHVKLDTNDPLTPPKIQFNYNTTEADKKVMREGVRWVRELIGTAAFEKYRDRELKPGIDATTNDQLDAFVQAHGESAYHPSCTCKMGEDEMAVVNARGQVHGIEGLRVIDASIMPSVTNGNLNAPVIMMAEKLSDDILGR
jgi:choline dehydrogenase